MNQSIQQRSKKEELELSQCFKPNLQKGGGAGAGGSRHTNTKSTLYQSFRHSNVDKQIN